MSPQRRGQRAGEHYKQRASDLSWHEDAACAGAPQELFFPDQHEGGVSREAVAICRRCPVRVDCLEYALETNEGFGVWGGLSPNERRRIRRGRSPPPGSR